MKPDRAHSLGVDPAEVRISCEKGRYSDQWVAWVPDDRRPTGRHVLTQGGIYALCVWLGRLRDMSES